MISHFSFKHYGQLRVSDEENPFTPLVEQERFEHVPELRLWCEVAFRAHAAVQTYLLTLKYHLWGDAKDAQLWVYSRHTHIGSLIWIAETCFPNFADLLIKEFKHQTPKLLPLPLIDSTPTQHPNINVVSFAQKYKCRRKVQSNNYHYVRTLDGNKYHG